MKKIKFNTAINLLVALSIGDLKKKSPVYVFLRALVSSNFSKVKEQARQR